MIMTAVTAMPMITILMLTMTRTTIMITRAVIWFTGITICAPLLCM